MRGSVYYQATQLVRIIFKEKAKKEHRIDPSHEHYQTVASYNTMSTYRQVWENFFNYLKEHWKVKNCELITSEHIEAYFLYKIEYNPSKQYAQKISSALGKLEVALTKYSNINSDTPIVYDFKIRQNILNDARDMKVLVKSYINRTYSDPLLIINNLSSFEHILAATIQLEGGARVEGVSFIKENQLKGLSIDKITNKDIGIIETKEKGGKIGDILISVDTYNKLENWFTNSTLKYFKINYQQYSNDIKNTCLSLNIIPNGSHGFRWTFAQNRVREYQKYGYNYEQALQGVSWEMKHFRASITEHYLG